MSDTSKLRWALHEGVYQPALVFPPEDLGDTELPTGHTVVYLLGLDSNVVVPDTDVSDYDPRDTAKMSNPAAALGVAMAQQILEGFQRGGTAADRNGRGDDVLDDNGGEGGDEANRADASDLHLLADDDDADADDARRRRHEEKKLRKEEKRKAKEARKAAKAAVKREREDITSAPTRQHSDDDDDNDNNTLLAAMAIERKYSAKHGARSTVKEERRDNDEEEVGAGTNVRGRAKKKPAAEGSWAALQEDLFSDDDGDSSNSDDAEADAGGEQRGHRHRGRSDDGREQRVRTGNRMGQALAALNAANTLHDIPGLSGSCPYAQPFLMEIHYEYEQLAREAASEGLLLSLQKGEVVRAIDDELRQKAAQRAFLESVLRTREHQSTSASAQNEVEAIYSAIEQLDVQPSVADTVRRLISKTMPRRAVGFDRMAAARARRAVERRTRTFQDATVVTLLDHLRSVDAVPREDGIEVMRGYIQQRRQHAELKSNFRGLSKTGFYAVPKPLEKWRRARDMMVLANVGAEAQKVLPTSYISQARSSMVRRMKEHAEKRYERLAVNARDGASFLDSSSFAGGALDPAVASSSPFTAANLSGMLTQQQQRLAAARAITQRHEAFFQFHTLRCDTEAPVAVETVALNADYAGAGLSQNVLASVDDVTASMLIPASATTTAALGGGGVGSHMDDSVNTDDGVSQASYSVHSAAPSSYPYIFDSEPRPRGRQQQQQQQRVGASSRSGFSSVSEGASSRATSRATSVGSAFSEHNDVAVDDALGTNGEAKEQVGGKSRRHRHRSTGAKNPANGGVPNSASTTAAGNADWRTNAKRSIMEQLTLYCRGRGGKPAILSSDQCREIGRTLLDRAMRAEAEREGVSLAVQSNNIAAPFTKTTEQRLKKSVDHYVERQIAQHTLFAFPANHETITAESGILGAGDRVGGVLPTPSETNTVRYYAAAAAAAARQRAVADTPIYEN
jgi:hypothetical protein